MTKAEYISRTISDKTEYLADRDVILKKIGQLVNDSNRDLLNDVARIIMENSTAVSDHVAEYNIIDYTTPYYKS